MNDLTQLLGRIERTGEGPVVLFDRAYATSAEDLWQACTDPERLARWFAPVTGDLSPGGLFTIHFDDADTPVCRVVTCEPPRLVSWEWPVGGVASLVTVEVRPDGDGSRLLLRHERLTGAQVAGYAAGWDTYLRALQAHLDGTAAPDWDETWSALHELYASAG